MAVEKVISVRVKTEKAEKDVNELAEGVENVDKKVKDTEDSSKSLMDSLDKLTKGMISSFRDSVKTVKGLTKGFVSLRGAIIATGIGALVVALGSLVTFFTKTQRGADKLSQAFAGIGATIDVLVDRVSSFGEGLFMIISGDISEGLEILKNSFKGIGEEIREESAAAIQLEKDLQALEDREIEMIKTRTKLRREIEEARLAYADVTKTDEERISALEKAIKLENELADQEIAIAAERVRIITEQNALGESTRDDLRAQAEAEARLDELQAQRASRSKELVGVLSALKAKQMELTEEEKESIRVQQELKELEEERARIRRSQASLDQEAIEEIQSQALLSTLSKEQQEIIALENSYADKLALLKTYGEDTTAVEDQIEREKAAIRKKYRDQETKATENNNQLKLEAEFEAAKAIFGAASSLGDALIKDEEKRFKFNKAAGLANAVINTAEGVTKALAAQNYVAAGVTAASGAAQIATIASRKFTTSDTSAPQPRAIEAPSSSPSFNIVGAANNTQLADDIAGALNRQPVRAYVVGSEVTSQQQLDRNRINQVSFP